MYRDDSLIRSITFFGHPNLSKRHSSTELRQPKQIRNVITNLSPYVKPHVGIGTAKDCFHLSRQSSVIALRYGTRPGQYRFRQAVGRTVSQRVSVCVREKESKRAKHYAKGVKEGRKRNVTKKSLCAFDKRRTVFGLKGSRWQLSICRVVRNRDQEHNGYLQGLSMGIDGSGC